jgi:hypothetical protein
MPRKNRDYKQEMKTAKARGEDKGKSRRTVDGRKARKEGKVKANQEVHHVGSNGTGKTKVISKSKNRSMGGKKGNKEGKARGGRKGGIASGKARRTKNV